MKRIVIFCDGTWNRSDSTTPTNVVQLARAVEPSDASGIVQIPIYIQGVGTDDGVTWLSRTLDRTLGGAFGWGLLENIVEAYRHLVFLYEPGDAIQIFGFSRGAYTARSLAGFIRSTGIVNRNALDRIPEAIRRYRTMGDPTTHPDSDESHRFRSELSPGLVTSRQEAEWRRAQGRPDAPRLRIDFLGVWDTVGALGVPAHVPVIGSLTRRRYRFHDADLSSMVASARHAVALDERRRAFEPARWTNVAELNAAAPDPAAQPYRELFFAGDHGSVGGGGDIRDLSSIALDWMIEGAERAGLRVNASQRDAIRAECKPLGPLCNRSEPPRGLGESITRFRPRDRTGPERLDELHDSVLTRWSDTTLPKRYRPGSLSTVNAAILAWHEAQGTEGTTRHA